MRNRNKYDWSKPFKFIDSKKTFDQLETNNDNFIINIEIEETKTNNAKKQEIITPKI